MEEKKQMKKANLLPFHIIKAASEVFFASTFWRKMQNIFGECCISKLEKVAKPRPTVILPATSHCRPYLVVTE